MLLTPAVLGPLALIAAGCADQSPTGVSAGGLLAGKAAPPAAEATRYLVGLEPGATLSPAALAAAGGAIVDAIPAFNVVVVEGATKPDALKSAAGVSYVEAEFQTQIDPVIQVADGGSANGAGTPGGPDGINAPVADPSTAAFYASHVQWDVAAMHADEAWPVSVKGARINVCIVDTGVDDQHQELNGGKVSLRANFVTSPASEALPTIVNDLNGHGSHVASEAAGNGVVVAGIANQATVMGARVLNAAGSGSETAIVNGIRWCADNGAHVINMSLGGIRYRGQTGFTTSPITYGTAINYARSKGAVVVVSAGNSNLQLPNPGNAQITVPAEIPGVITVGATGPTSKIPQLAPPNWNPFDPSQVWQGPDYKAYYSNYGTGVTVFGPGGRGTVPLSASYLYVGGQVQGGPYDQIYGACASTTTQTGAVVNVGGTPTAASGTCSGQTNRYIAYAGTSMAAPHVTGVVALLYGEIGGAPSTASAARVEACLKNNTDNIGPASIYGGGRVNAKKAVDALHGGSC